MRQFDFYCVHYGGKEVGRHSSKLAANEQAAAIRRLIRKGRRPKKSVRVIPRNVGGKRR
jgi:hypothetical protein